MSTWPRSLQVMRALGPIDLMQLRRDAMLPWIVALPILIALLMRFGLPAVSPVLESRFGWALTDYQVLMASFLVMMMPILCGTVIGFLLLDEKDDRTLIALQVTPLSPAAYLAYRTLVPMAISVATTPLMLALSGLERLSLGAELLAALGAAPLAPCYALFIAATAANKVQGFAIVKAAGIINWPPIVAYFVRDDWQWLFGLCPTFWQPKLYWALAEGSAMALPVALVNYAYLVILSWLFLRRLRRTLGSV